MLKMTTEYKGYVVEWRDFYRNFSISMDDKEVKSKVATLEDCEKWIDSKLKQKYKRVPVIVRERWGGSKTIEGEATSAIDAEYVWVVAKNGERSKVKAADTWLATPANIEALKQISSKEAEVFRLQAEIKEIIEASERLTITMMVDG